MYFKDIAYTMKETHTLDKKYKPRKTYTESPIFCNIKSIGQSEFYQSATIGLKPEIKLETKLPDLNNVTHVKYNDKVYKILRIYKKADICELILSSTVIDN